MPGRADGNMALGHAASIQLSILPPLQALVTLS